MEYLPLVLKAGQITQLQEGDNIGTGNNRNMSLLLYPSTVEITNETDMLDGYEFPFGVELIEVRAKTEDGTVDVALSSSLGDIITIGATSDGVIGDVLSNSTLDVYGKLIIDTANASGFGLSITIKFKEV